MDCFAGSQAHRGTAERDRQSSGDQSLRVGSAQAQDAQASPAADGRGVEFGRVRRGQAVTGDFRFGPHAAHGLAHEDLRTYH